MLQPAAPLLLPRVLGPDFAELANNSRSAMRRLGQNPAIAAALQQFKSSRPLQQQA